MKRRKPLRLVIAMLLMLSVVITTGTFAFWASEIEGTSQTHTSTLEIGSAQSVKTTISLQPAVESSFGYLVPTGQLENSVGIVTDKVDFVYQVLWNEQQETTQIGDVDTYGALSVDITYEIIIDGETLPLDTELYKNIYELINVIDNSDNPSVLLLNSGVSKDYGFSVTLNEPANKTEYDLITNSTINLNIEFKIDTDIYDLNLNFVDMNMDDLLKAAAVSPNMANWTIEEDESLESEDNYNEKYMFFPITEDEYTLTVTANLQNIESLSGGYGILFDTYLEEDTYNDTGYILQFDRGYANGELILRARVFGGEKNPFLRAGSEDDFLPSKYSDPSWWISEHEITLEVSNYDETTREVSIYLDGEFIKTTTYDKVDNDGQMYVGFRIWGNSASDFYSLTVE